MQALLAIAGVDTDAVWLLLTQLATEAAPGRLAHPVPSSAPKGTFRPLGSLLPPRRSRGPLTQHQRNDGVGARAKALLSRLEAAEMTPEWLST